MRSKIYGLDDAVKKLALELGHKRFIVLATVSGEIIIEPYRAKVYEEIIYTSVIGSDGRIEHHFRLPDLRCCSKNTRIFIAAEIVSLIIFQDVFKAMPRQEFIDAVAILYIEEKLHKLGVLYDIIDDCTRIEKNKSVQSQLNYYWIKRFDSGNRIISESAVMRDKIIDYINAELPEADEYEIGAISIIELLKSKL